MRPTNKFSTTILMIFLLSSIVWQIIIFEKKTRHFPYLNQYLRCGITFSLDGFELAPLDGELKFEEYVHYGKSYCKNYYEVKLNEKPLRNIWCVEKHWPLISHRLSEFFVFITSRTSVFCKFFGKSRALNQLTKLINNFIEKFFEFLSPSSDRYNLLRRTQIDR